MEKTFEEMSNWEQLQFLNKRGKHESTRDWEARNYLNWERYWDQARKQKEKKAAEDAGWKKAAEDWCRTTGVVTIIPEQEQDPRRKQQIEEWVRKTQAEFQGHQAQRGDSEGKRAWEARAAAVQEHYWKTK